MVLCIITKEFLKLPKINLQIPKVLLIFVLASKRHTAGTSGELSMGD